jgi:putative endonuclease
MKKYFVYLARCSDNSLYIGNCSNLKNREKKHNMGEGAAYTKQRQPVKIVYFEEFDTLLEAVKRERQLKGWTRIKKENLIKYGHPTKF